MPGTREDMPHTAEYFPAAFWTQTSVTQHNETSLQISSALAHQRVHMDLGFAGPFRGLIT
jgi:hypothetical protein